MLGCEKLKAFCLCMNFNLKFESQRNTEHWEAKDRPLADSLVAGKRRKMSVFVSVTNGVGGPSVCVMFLLVNE